MRGWVMDNWLDLAGLILLVYAAYPANGIWRILGRTPWRASVVGRVLFSKAMMIALVLNLATVAVILRLLDLGRPVWFEVVRMVVFLGVGTTLWWQRDVFRDLARNEMPPDPTHRKETTR